MKHLPLFIAMLSFLLSGWVISPGGVKLNFEESMILVGTVLFLLAEKRFRLSKPFLLVFGVLFSVGFVHLLLGNNDAFFVRIFMGMFMAYLFFDYVIRRNREDLELIIKFYLNGVLIISIVGIIQFISFHIGFKYGYHFDWIFPTHRLSYENVTLRINSYFGEPSQIGQILAPAFFLSICSLFNIKPAFLSKKKALVIIFVYFFSKSSLAMIGIVASFGLLAIHYMSITRFVQGVGATVLVFFLIYNHVSNFRTKLTTAQVVFTSGLVSDHSVVGGSFFTLFENTLVAVENLKRNPITGTGVGSHHVAFGKYALSKNDPLYAKYISYNVHDASSLFNRITSEMGLLGLIFIVIYIIKNFVRKKDGESNAYWIMSSASLVVLLVSLVRKGHYFGGGLALFVLLFYYVNLEYKRYLRTRRELQENARIE